MDIKAIIFSFIYSKEEALKTQNCKIINHYINKIQMNDIENIIKTKNADFVDFIIKKTKIFIPLKYVTKWIDNDKLTYEIFLVLFKYIPMLTDDLIETAITRKNIKIIQHIFNCMHSKDITELMLLLAIGTGSSYIVNIVYRNIKKNLITKKIIFSAIESKDINIVKIILDDISADLGSEYLNKAIYRGEKEIIKYIVDYTNKLELDNYILESSFSCECADIIAENMPDNRIHRKSFELAIKYKKLDVVEILSKKAPKHISYELLYSASYKDLNIFKCLLKYFKCNLLDMELFKMIRGTNEDEFIRTYLINCEKISFDVCMEIIKLQKLPLIYAVLPYILKNFNKKEIFIEIFRLRNKDLMTAILEKYRGPLSNPMEFYIIAIKDEKFIQQVYNMRGSEFLTPYIIEKIKENGWNLKKN